jgi:hypothetical protein
MQQQRGLSSMSTSAILQQAISKFEEAGGDGPPFLPAPHFQGAKPGYFFSRGAQGLGCVLKIPPVYLYPLEYHDREKQSLNHAYHCIQSHMQLSLLKLEASHSNAERHVECRYYLDGAAARGAAAEAEEEQPVPSRPAQRVCW